MNNTIDSGELLERVGDDRDLLCEIADTFRTDWPVQMEAARVALASADAEGVERAAHCLKGALANLAANSARELAARIEDQGRSCQLEHLDSSLVELEQELNRVTAALDALCRGGRS